MAKEKNLIELELAKADPIQDQIDDIIIELIRIRKKTNLTQIELSKLSGIPQTTISRIEAFRTNPSLQVLLKLFNALGFTLLVKRSDISDIF